MTWTNSNGKWVQTPLHDSMSGIPAFIVCNGPSLVHTDTSSITGPGRVVIALNNAAPRVRPDWWVGMDSSECYESCIGMEPYPKLIRPNNLAKFPGWFNLNTVDIREDVAFYDGGAKDALRWDHDTFRIAIQFTILLGCRDIFFVGVDLDNTQNDYADGSYLTNDQRANNARLYNANFDFLKWHIKNRPAVKFLSSSPSSRINEIMPNIPLGTAIKRIEDQIPRGRHVLHNSALEKKSDLSTKQTTLSVN